MGGGYVTRPNLYATQPNPNDPMTEFYLLLQEALGQQRRFTLPGCYAAFRPPLDEPLYAEDLPACCEFSGQPRAGWRTVFASRPLAVLYDSLRLTHEASPAALILTEEASRRTYAVQLLPPFAGAGVAVPPMPDAYAALSLQLTANDLSLADTAPARLGRLLCQRTEGKQWAHHPAIDQWMTTALAATQREYRRRKNPPFR